jgi:4-phytase/acid phosphatase/peptide/nickel transport system substrate-binding protein
VADAIHDTLIHFDPKTGKLEPNLALSWSQSADKLTWTLKLKQGVKFHDGTEFTAKDAAEHMNRMLDPKNKSASRSFITAIKAAEVLDTYTVRFYLAHPWMPMPAILASIAMIGLIPSHANVAAGKQNRSPVGTGPYRFKSWAGGDRIVVERFADYHGKPGRAERIVFRILPDTQARYAALKAGEVDVIWTDRGNTIVAAKKEKSLKVLVRDGKGAEITFFNASKPPLDDARVRQALAHAWNQKAILEVTWKNTRPFARSALGAAHKCNDGYLEYDPAKAKKLLAAYGKPVEVEMIHTTTPRGRELGEVMQQLYKKVGVTLKLVPVDQNTLVKKVFTNEYQISGWRIGDANDVGPQLFALAISKSSYNLSRDKSEAFDKAAMAMRTAADRKSRDEGLCTLSRLMNESGSMQFRGGNRYHAITRANVHGVTFHPLGVARVRDAWKK